MLFIWMKCISRGCDIHKAGGGFVSADRSLHFFTAQQLPQPAAQTGHSSHPAAQGSQLSAQTAVAGVAQHDLPVAPQVAGLV
jgi:hypothetical protein